jgi:PAS domain S-box-containing protein
VAASPLALSLLGYQHEEQLFGERIIRIVPARYHQAHIAGTTLHVTNGRSPLLGVRVTVPVVRADGTEAPMGLEVRPRSLPGGGRLFVAEFFVDDATEPSD